MHYNVPSFPDERTQIFWEEGLPLPDPTRFIALNLKMTTRLRMHPRCHAEKIAGYACDLTANCDTSRATNSMKLSTGLLVRPTGSPRGLLEIERVE